MLKQYKSASVDNSVVPKQIGLIGALNQHEVSWILIYLCILSWLKSYESWLNSSSEQQHHGNYYIAVGLSAEICAEDRLDRIQFTSQRKTALKLPMILFFKITDCMFSNDYQQYWEGRLE